MRRERGTRALSQILGPGIRPCFATHDSDTGCQVLHITQDHRANSEARILALLGSRGSYQEVGRNKIIFQEGDRASNFFRVASGTVQLSKRRTNGRRQIVRLLLPGDLFGFEIGERRRFTAESVDQAVVTKYPSDVIDEIADSSPDLYRALMKFLRRQLQSTHEHAVMLGRETALERVAAFILLLSKRKNIEDGQILTLPMRRRDFADYLGLSTETVSRMLTKLKDAGLILVSRDHGKFVICDVDSLIEVMLDARDYGIS